MIDESFCLEKVHDNATIAAIATPLIPSAIGIIRVSGPQSVKVIEVIFKTNRVVDRRMVNGTAKDQNNNIIDDCCYTFYKGPKSYTGEDVLEIFCHGSIYIVKELIKCITIIPDCRLAKNGEFTQRAFINGKIPLSKAESILDIIESNSKASHSIALNQYQGQVYQTIANVREDVLTVLQKIEASLEFPDDVGTINTKNIAMDMTKISNKLQPIIISSDYGKLIKTGLTYLIIGEPNVGKSSILNQLSGESRSIVTESAGTTRDYIDICIEYNGILITLIDTAGIRETNSKIEKIGIEKIEELSKSANGYILVEDASANHDFIWPKNLDESKPTIKIKNKSDLIQLKKETNHEYLYVSCKKNTGLTKLKETLVSTFIDPSHYEETQMLSNIRQLSALNETAACIERAKTQLLQKNTLDVICIELRDAIQSLSDIMGDSFTEELLDGIFSKFCIGK